MASSPQLLFVVPFPIAGAAALIASATFAVVGPAGMLLPSPDLLALAGPGGRQGLLVRLGMSAVIDTADATGEARLAIEREDGTDVPLPGTTVRVSGLTAMPAVQSPLVDITASLKSIGILGMRLQARASTGVMTLHSPTVSFYRGISTRTSH